MEKRGLHRGITVASFKGSILGPLSSAKRSKGRLRAMFLCTLVLRSTAQLFDEAPTFRDSLLQVHGSISPKIEPQRTIATPLDDDDGT
ncbi:uncharacterized protein CLUP02_16467 [Colletotrichum lupini]|uniref:Uncharacterized protein n=1 Tax=Colletotrichum lupini TaxID=145971 RepID=A0A9Q8WQ67_9PEZI|nr:uncharacterized protein CLUP02_16467 [Colletotrichum lupini]UQC90935.1 hypothetical protein CLUP02_16467 [Colletotrichum lupini]